MNQEHIRTFVPILSLILLSPVPIRAQDAALKVVDPRLKIELYAEHPQIVTPTGIDIDSLGRVWALESNTHFPPEGYSGHKTDRLLVMSGRNANGRAEKIQVFADGLVHAMSVTVRPPWYPSLPRKGLDGKSSSISVYVATRREILQLHDDDGNATSDRREQLVHLETEGNYPHNGLAGMALDAMGWLYFGFGENLGADYTIIGRDGAKLRGGGEGGNIYRCRLDGGSLEQIATGFWNPHASCFDAFGRMFSVDNDPDSRPPCRLLHIIPHGDYGYRFRNGRKGLHPFTAWDGEIPGTLPMVAGTGEAPSGVVSYESDGLPPDYLGNLLVGSWGDHRIDRFRLNTKGSSYTSLAVPVVTGNENFRPVGLAVAPDGSLYFTDWVLRDYKLHGKGRIWRVSSVTESNLPPIDLATLSDKPVEELYKHLSSPHLPVRRMAAFHLAQRDGDRGVSGRTILATQIADTQKSPRSRVEALWALANLSLAPQRPDDLFPMLRTLVVGANESTFQTSGRNEIQSVAKWIQDPRLIQEFPSFGEVLRLTGSLTSPSRDRLDREFYGRGGSRYDAYALAQRYSQLVAFDASTARNEWFQSNDIRDPFLFALVVEQCSRVDTPSRLKDWWFAQTTSKPPSTESNPLPFSATTSRFLESGSAPSNVTAEVIVLAARRKFPKNVELLNLFLKDTRNSVRALAVQWVAEEHLKDLRPAVAEILNDSQLDRKLFLATIAALEMLDGISPTEFDKTPASKYVLPLLTKSGTSPQARIMALRLTDPTDPSLTVELLRTLISDPTPGMRLEVIRSLQQSRTPDALSLLRETASNPQLSIDERTEALVGLGHIAPTEATTSEIRTAIDGLIRTDDHALQREAIRALRGAAAAGKPSEALAELVEKWNANRIKSQQLSERQELAEQLQFAFQGVAKPPELSLIDIVRPKQLTEWEGMASHWIRQQTIPQRVRRDANESDLRVSIAPMAPEGFPTRLNSNNSSSTVPIRKPSMSAGRRVFFSANSAGCSKCHTIEGRGGKLGPDLTSIARTMSWTKLAESILTPSREMAPQFVPWSFELVSGQVLTGLILSEESEKLKIGTPDTSIHDLKLSEIASRTPQSASFMPEKLYEQLTVQEFFDLLAFLESLK